MSRNKYMESKSLSQQQITNLLLVAAAGGVVGVTAALLLTPKTGPKLRKEIRRVYEDLTEKGQEFAEDLLEKGQCAVNSASDYAENIRDTASNFYSPSSSCTNTNLLIGAIGGGVLGAAAVLISKIRSEDEVDESFTHRIKSAAAEKIKSVDWLDTARELLDTINSKVNPHHHHNGASEVEEEEHSDNFQNALDWANVGIRLWKNIKNKR